MQNYQQTFVLNLLAYAAQRRVSVNQLCQDWGVDLNDLTRPKPARLTTKQTDDHWQNAGHLSHNPLFGLYLGESLQIAALGVVGGLVQNSHTDQLVGKWNSIMLR